jgi:hypothetical protein
MGEQGSMLREFGCFRPSIDHALLSPNSRFEFSIELYETIPLTAMEGSQYGSGQIGKRLKRELHFMLRFAYSGHLFAIRLPASSYDARSSRFIGQIPPLAPQSSQWFHNIGGSMPLPMERARLRSSYLGPKRKKVDASSPRYWEANCPCLRGRIVVKLRHSPSMNS